MTEQQFVALTPEERETLGAQMPVTFDVLREVIREADRRAKDGLAKGNIRAAERTYTAFERLASANSGPNVTLLADLIGKWIDKRAKAGLSALHHAQATQPAGK